MELEKFLDLTVQTSRKVGKTIKFLFWFWFVVTIVGYLGSMIGLIYSYGGIGAAISGVYVIAIIIQSVIAGVLHNIGKK